MMLRLLMDEMEEADVRQRTQTSRQTPAQHAHMRKNDELTACGSELSKRGAQFNPPSFAEVDQETVLGDPATLIRSQRPYRVF